MPIDDCPTPNDRFNAANSHNGSSTPEDRPLGTEADPLLDADYEAMYREAAKDDYIESLNDALPEGGSGIATEADMATVRSTASKLNDLVNIAVKGQTIRLEKFDDALKYLGGLTSGDDSKWLNWTTRMASWFTDENASLDNWVIRNAVDKTKSMADQPLIRERKSMLPKINAQFDKINRSSIAPFMKFVRPIAQRLGYSDLDMAIILGEYANALAVPEKNTELMRRWKAELDELSKLPPDEISIAVGERIQELTKNIENLTKYNNMADLAKIPDTLVSSGYTASQAAHLIRLIEDKIGVTKEEGLSASKLLTDWSYNILKERAAAGTIADPTVFTRFPVDFLHYVPFQNKIDLYTGAVNDTHSFNPGTYHSMQGSRHAPDSAFLTLLAYSRRAATEIGMQDFAVLMAAKARLDKQNHVDNGLRLYKKRDIDGMKKSSNIRRRQWASNFDTQGGLAVDVPNAETGRLERSWVAFNPNWVSEDGKLDGMALNAALSSSSKVAGGMHKLAVANGWYGQMFTRFTPMFSVVNGTRDLMERSFHLSNMTFKDANGREVRGLDILPSYFGGTASSMRLLLDGIRGVEGSEGLRLFNEYRAMGLHQEYTYGMDRKGGPRSLRDLGINVDSGKLDTRGSSVTQTLINKNPKLRRAFADVQRFGSDGLKRLDALNDYFNNVGPFNEYVALRKAGVSAEQAGAAVLSSMNLTLQGKTTPTLMAFMPFVKPTMQSAAATARALGLVYDPRGFIHGGKNGWKYAIGSLMAYYMLQPVLRDSMGQDPETGMDRWDTLSMGELGRFIPIGMGGGTYAKVPLGFGPAQIITTFVNGWDRHNRGLMTGEDFAFETLFTLGKNMMAGNWPDFKFTEDPLSYLAQMVTPGFLSPFTQVATNRSHFGSPITYADRDSNDTPMAKQGRSSTPLVYHDAAKGILSATGIDFAPEQIRAVVQGLSIGPMRILRSLLETDQEYKVQKEHGSLDEYPERGVPDNLFLAGLKAMGAGQFLGSAQNESRQFFYQALNYYTTKLKRSGVDITSTVYGDDPIARRKYQAVKLAEAGFTENEIEDFLTLREALAVLRKGTRDFNLHSRDLWLQANDSAAAKEALRKLAEGEADVYDEIVPQLYYFGGSPL